MMSSKEFTDTQLDFEVRGETTLRDAAREDRAKMKAEELGLIRARLATSITGNVSRAADRVADAGASAMTEEGWAAFSRSVRNVASAAELDQRLAKLQKRYAKRAEGPRVTREQRVYDTFSPHSYFLDRVAIVEGAGDAFAAAAQARMARYDAELKHEIRCRSREGRRAERLIGEQYRQDVVEINRRVVCERQAEARALGTGGGATASAGSGAAAFVSPYFAFTKWAPFRGAHRTFADQCSSLPLPPYGLQVYVPTVSSTVSVSQQTEGQAVSNTDPSTALVSAQIETVTGQVTISQQVSDRGFTGGGSFDIVVSRQLQQQLDEKINLYALNQALAGAATVVGQSSFTIAGLYQDLAAGREKLTDTAGTRLRPTHLFTTSDFYSYVTRQVDDDHRPIVVPQFAPGFPIAAGDAQAKWSRFTGTVLPGGVLWFEDDVIPTVGTTSETQLIVSAPDEAMLLLEGDPIFSVYPQTDAASLELVAGLRSYVAAIPRYASGTASIAGAAYTSALGYKPRVATQSAARCGSGANAPRSGARSR
jgi:hypothetical protein